MEFLTLEFKLEDVDADAKKAKIKGYASTFGNIDLGLDRVQKGAFIKTIKENGGKVPILDQHRADSQLGWNMKAKEDDNGLLCEGELDLNVQKAVERFSLSQTAMKIGAPMGLSIGYAAIKAEPDRDNRLIRNLQEVKMYEYSYATFPMNTQAALTQAKSLVGIDKANFLIAQFIKQGISVEEMTEALAQRAAEAQDPNALVQSMQKLIESMKVS